MIFEIFSFMQRSNIKGMYSQYLQSKILKISISYGAQLMTA